MGLPVDFPLPDPSTPGDDPTADAAAAWGAVARLFISHQSQREQIAAELGMTMGELIPLLHLVPAEGLSQRVLAERWSCDPSWVTNRVDRLEELGLAERQVSPADRRVKEVWLTEEGVARRSRGLAAFAAPPPELLALAPADLEALARILAKLDPALADGGTPPAAP